MYVQAIHYSLDLTNEVFQHKLDPMTFVELQNTNFRQALEQHRFWAPPEVRPPAEVLQPTEEATKQEAAVNKPATPHVEPQTMDIAGPSQNPTQDTQYVGEETDYSARLRLRRRKISSLLRGGMSSSRS